MELESIIKRPIVLTEKASSLREGENQYVFEVDLQANKIEIRDAVERLFKVSVDCVNTMIVRGQPRQVRGRRETTKTSNWKKAIVTLRDGESIDFFEGA